MKFEAPEIKTINFEVEDIITASFEMGTQENELPWN